MIVGVCKLTPTYGLTRIQFVLGGVIVILAIIIFFLVSILLSMVGLGGGAFYVPLLLALGYGFQGASTISLFLIMVAGFAAFLQFRQAKLVDWQLAVVMETFTDIGAFAGGFTSRHFSDVYLKILFGILLLIASYFIIRMQWRKGNAVKLKTGFGYWQREFAGNNYSIFIPAIIPIIFAIGYLSGLLGVAGGLLKIPIMILWFSVPAKIAVATSSLMVSLTGLLGFGGHLINISIDWGMAIGLGVVVFIGGQIGSRISVKLPEKKVKVLLAIVFVLLGLWMIMKSVFL